MVRKFLAGIVIGSFVLLGVTGAYADDNDKDEKFRKPPHKPPTSVVPVPTPQIPVPAPPLPQEPANCCGGTADPLGLIASAAIVPFWSQGSFFSIFELTSLGENPGAHAFFFASNCSRVFSIPFRMSAHDAAIVDSHDLGLNFDGLVAFAKSTNGLTAVGLDSPITARVHRVNFGFDAISVVDPIGARHAEDFTRTWNPLRSAASTITFPDSPFHTTTWWVVCPQGNIGADVRTEGIPDLPPAPSLIRLRAFDTDENFAFDLQFTCQCLTEVKPGKLHPLFNTEARYVEMVTYVNDEPIANPPAFVLYREMRFGPIGGFAAEGFGRAPGMSAATLLSETPFQLAR